LKALNLFPLSSNNTQAVDNIKQPQPIRRGLLYS
jgi:hypothetical protein